MGFVTLIFYWFEALIAGRYMLIFGLKSLPCILRFMEAH